MSLKLAILATIGSLPFELVPVPEFGEGMKLRVTTMSVAERDQFDSAYRTIPEVERTEKFRSLLVIHTVKDGDNQPIFDEGNIADIRELSSVAVTRLVDVSMRLNNMIKKSGDEAEKKS